MVKFSRPLQICCVVTLLLLIIITVTAVTLYFTVFKPKQPKITTQSVTLDSFSTNLFDLRDTNVTLGIMVTIDNPNYGGFKYGNSTTYVTYHGSLVAEAPIMEATIPARGRHDVGTTVLVIGKSLLTNPSFSRDQGNDTYNFTSSSTIEGKAIVMKLFKMKATSYCICNISVHFLAKNSTTVCTSKVKF
ncbi:late embryogenesis abundant protein, LEA-14 [Artemisia annua]|uniref:Late embryogenesis abundant protein, LEA-14 n=1 Tax=Artemisia annua TaxID=35608 RepID=A0A2U1QBP0_ARTAN|nr:late embryogenesis abundant protein, LEA-14 [Artemisia annua]